MSPEQFERCAKCDCRRKVKNLRQVKRTYGMAWICVPCGKTESMRRMAGARVGIKTRTERFPNWKQPDHANPKVKQSAIYAVKREVKAGRLPNLKERVIKCTDCKARATQYDHRDYSKPIDVQPVCRSCNLRRGTAIWPTP